MKSLPLNTEGVKMRLAEVRRRVKWIERKANEGDNEIAHDKEDRLLWAFVDWISSDEDSRWQEVAEEILKSADIDFGRWYS